MAPSRMYRFMVTVGTWMIATSSFFATAGETIDPASDGSQFAWSENAGWISFSCANTAGCGEVSYGITINTSTGVLSGYAWSENIGWLIMSCETGATCASVDYGITTETPIPENLFSDNFETSDISRWSVSGP